jgi:hypothetical protein
VRPVSGLTDPSRSNGRTNDRAPSNSTKFHPAPIRLPPFCPVNTSTGEVISAYLPGLILPREGWGESASEPAWVCRKRPLPLVMGSLWTPSGNTRAIGGVPPFHQREISVRLLCLPIAALWRVDPFDSSGPCADGWSTRRHSNTSRTPPVVSDQIGEDAVKASVRATDSVLENSFLSNCRFLESLVVTAGVVI